ncbi:MAG: hypothetical protein ACREIQ_12370 [Nitrospiria bacterium]
MISRGWFYVSYMIFFVGVIYLIGLFLGNVYARYALAYTGTIFIAGMLLGQKSGRAWDIRQDDPRKATPVVGKNVQGRKE